MSDRIQLKDLPTAEQIRKEIAEFRQSRIEPLERAITELEIERQKIDERIRCGEDMPPSVFTFFHTPSRFLQDAEPEQGCDGIDLTLQVAVEGYPVPAPFVPLIEELVHVTFYFYRELGPAGFVIVDVFNRFPWWKMTCFLLWSNRTVVVISPSGISERLHAPFRSSE